MLALRRFGRAVFLGEWFENMTFGERVFIGALQAFDCVVGAWAVAR